MSSSCAHCNAVEQRGRYCVGCGKLMPPSQLPSRRVRLAAVHFENEDDTQPVLRFRHSMPRPRVPQEETAAV